MKPQWLLVSLPMGSLGARAQDEISTLPDLLPGAQEWAAENLDPDFLNSLPELDKQQVQQFLRDLQKQFQGEYIVNLAALRDAANAVLPVLETYEEALPYVAWLRPRLDYLKVADELRFVIPPPVPVPGKPYPPVRNPGAIRQREVWVKEVAKLPWPPGASNQVARLEPIFAGEKVPPELVWLAEVESAFDPHARSPAGAAGLFQLMPDTARRFGRAL